MQTKDFPRFKDHDFPIFDDYVEELGLTDRTSIAAEKRAIAREIALEMKKAKITKVEMAVRMGTSRAQVDRVLNGPQSNAKLETLAKAARLVGKRLTISLI
jgi:antitoxin HicB